MKFMHIATVCAILAGATPAFAATAPTRDDLEKQAVDHANKANDQVTVAIDAFKAGDTAKGCVALLTSYNELGISNDFLAQDIDLMRGDKLLADADRTKAIADVESARTDASSTRELIKQKMQAAGCATP